MIELKKRMENGSWNAYEWNEEKQGYANWHHFENFKALEDWLSKNGYEITCATAVAKEV